MTAGHDPELYAGDLIIGDAPDPEPLPPELADEIARDEMADEPVERPADGRRATLLARALGSIFKLTGIVAGFGLPAAYKERVRGIWTLPAKDAAEIAVGLLPLIPEGWLRSRVIGGLGAAGGLFLLALSISERAEQTRAVRMEVIRGHATEAAGSVPAGDPGAGRARARRGGGAAPAAVEPHAGGVPVAPDGFTGDGIDV